MYVHILGSDKQKFLCGLLRNGERSFVPLNLYNEGAVKPAGQTQWCPICKAAADEAKGVKP